MYVDQVHGGTAGHIFAQLGTAGHSSPKEAKQSGDGYSNFLLVASFFHRR